MNIMSRPWDKEKKSDSPTGQENMVRRMRLHVFQKEKSKCMKIERFGLNNIDNYHLR